MLFLNDVKGRRRWFNSLVAYCLQFNFILMIISKIVCATQWKAIPKNDLWKLIISNLSSLLFSFSLRVQRFATKTTRISHSIYRCIIINAFSTSIWMRISFEHKTDTYLLAMHNRPNTLNIRALKALRHWAVTWERYALFDEIIMIVHNNNNNHHQVKLTCLVSNFNDETAIVAAAA